jgi:hypothetical protein
MTMIATLKSLAAEPASILYIATGAVGFVAAGVRKALSGSNDPDVSIVDSTAMLFCKPSARDRLKDLNLI